MNLIKNAFYNFGKEGIKMKVENLQKVKTDRYKEGQMFFTDKEVGILINGKIKKLNTTVPNMSQYVKKSEVEKMIDDKLKEVKK